MKLKTPPVAVDIEVVWIESAGGKVMVNEPVCSVFEAFTIEGLFTTLIPMVSPDVKN